MPDNSSVALGINANPVDIKSTLQALSQMQLANAHSGLYGLQAEQEARKLYANKAIQQYGLTPQGITEFARRGGDPSAIEGYQKGYATNNAFSQTGGLMPGDLKTFAEIPKIGAETQNVKLEGEQKRTDLRARHAQSVIADPGNNENWQHAVDAGVSMMPGNDLEKASRRKQLLGIADPQERLNIVKPFVMSGVSPADYTALHNTPPTDAVTSRAAVFGGSFAPPPGTAPTPNAQVAGRFGALPPAMTPGQLKESEAYGGEMAKVLPTLAEKANNSRQANFTLDQMRQESQTWDMGKGGTALMTAQQYLKPFANAIGSKVFDQPVAAFESFQKNAGTLVRQAVKEVSPRAAVQEFQLIQKQLPSSDMSRQGFNQITDQFQAVNDFNIAKHQAGQAWQTARKTMDGFETDWNKNITPAAFLVARLPADQLGALKANMQRTPEGRAALRSITTQLRWAHDHNLDGLLQ